MSASHIFLLPVRHLLEFPLLHFSRLMIVFSSSPRKHHDNLLFVFISFPPNSFSTNLLHSRILSIWSLYSTQVSQNYLLYKTARVINFPIWKGKIIKRQTGWISGPRRVFGSNPAVAVPQEWTRWAAVMPSYEASQGIFFVLFLLKLMDTETVSLIPQPSGWLSIAYITQKFCLLQKISCAEYLLDLLRSLTTKSHQVANHPFWSVLIDPQTSLKHQLLSLLKPSTRKWSEAASLASRE